MRWGWAFLHEWNCGKFIIEYHMILWADTSCTGIEDQCNTACVKGWVTEGTPVRERGSHFGGPVPSALCKRLFKMYIEQKRVWYVFTGMVSCFTPCSLDSGVLPSRSTYKLLTRSSIALNAKGQNIESTICGHIFMPGRSKVCAHCVGILFLFSIIPFWWWAPTPQM